MSLKDIESKTFHHATLISEWYRIVCLLAVLGALMAYTIARGITVDGFALLWVQTLVLALVVGHELVVLRAVRKALRDERDVPSATWVINVIVESQLPTLALFLLLTSHWMTPYQALVALGSGGVTGVGLGDGRQKLGFIPEHHTDFIFSVIGEELGLVATIGVIFGFALLAGCGLFIARHAPDAFGMLLASGITFLIGFQAVINIGVVTGSLPNKGISLPFLSYGGSNLVVMMASIGLLINVARHSEQPANNPRRCR